MTEVLIIPIPGRRIIIKIRAGFVTNSSSSSYVVLKITNEELAERLKSMGFDGVELTPEEESETGLIVVESFLKHVLETTGEEYYFTDDYNYLSTAYITYIKNMTGVDVDLKDICVYIHDESWGEFLEDLEETAGILCPHILIHHQWLNEKGEKCEKWQYLFDSEPEASWSSLDMIINNEKKIEEFVESLVDSVDDIQPVVLAFRKGFRKMKGLSDEQIEHYMGSYSSLPLTDSSTGIPYDPSQLPKTQLRVKSFVTGEAHSLVLSDRGEVFSLQGQINGLVVFADLFKSEKIHKLNQLPVIRTLSTGLVADYLVSENGELYKYEKKVDQSELIEDVKCVVDIAASYEHMLILTAEGTVYSCGNSWSCAALGQGEINSLEKPCLINDLPPAIAVGTGDLFSAVLTAAGELFTFGLNHAGLLGQKDKKHRDRPEKVELPLLTTIAAGRAHTLALTALGEVYTFGDGVKGQLGHGDGEDWYAPAKITGIPPIKAVAAGAAHSIFLTANGKVYACGDNKHGQLGITETDSVLSPQLIKGLPEIAAISAGSHCSLILSADGELYSFGDNIRDRKVEIRV